MNIVIEFLILSITLLSFAKSTNNNDYDYQAEDGDTIIDKILSSHRFTELANIIADKAVEKINNLDLDSVANNHAIPAPRFKTTDVKVNDDIDNDKPEQKHHTLEKIDIDAVLKTKVIPTKDLAFRYERFFKSTNNNTNTTETYLNTYDDTKAVSRTLKDNIESIDDDALESHELIGEQSRNDKDEDIKSEEKIDDRNKQVNNKGRSVENSYGYEDTLKENEKLESKDSGDNNNLNLDRKQGDNQDLEMDYEDSTKSNVPLLRREGDKVFAFEDSPDYKEYHEQLAMMRTKRH